MDRARGRDTQRVAVLFVRVSGVDWRPGEWNAGSLVSGEGVSHFLSEMSCGEVVAGSLLFPGRAFEFSSPSFFPSCLHPSPGGSRCASAILPLGGDSGQWITQTTAEVRRYFKSFYLVKRSDSAYPSPSSGPTMHLSCSTPVCHTCVS